MLLSAHVAGRNYTNNGIIASKRKSYLQMASIDGSAQSLKTIFMLAMLHVFQKQNELIEKDFLSLLLTDTVLGQIFTLIALIPLKSNDFTEVDHLYITIIYKFVKPFFLSCQVRALQGR